MPLSCGCSAGRASWKSSPRRRHSETLATTATPGARCGPKAAPPHSQAAHHVRRPATLRDAEAPLRSRSAPSLKSSPTAHQKAAETDIFKLDGTDICTLGLQSMSAQDRNVTERAK